jgi:hypothetical protein
MGKINPPITFNDFWDFFWEEARSRGYNQKEFMEICGLPKTRFNGFALHGRPNGMNVSPYYAHKIMEGLRMTEEYVERESGKKFSDDQRNALRRAAWTDHHPQIVDALATNKALTKKVLELITEYAKKQ